MPTPPSPSPTPSVSHGGLLVPNAVGLTYPRMAEPDQIDFATAANAQWGVVEGCKVTITTFTVMVDPGVAIVNGSMVTVAGGTVTLASSGAQDRFDSVVVNESGNVVVLPGTPSTDPVFVDVPLNNTLLAVVFCPVGAESFAGFVIDKRRFVSKALLTKIGGVESLIRNLNGDGNHYHVFGDGTTVWGGDTTLKRKSAKTLELDSHLIATGNVSAAQVNAGRVIATREVTGSNLIMGEAPPPTAQAPIGALFQSTVSGDVAVNTPAGWKSLAQVDGIMPVGSIINSVEPPSVMGPKGWLLLDGSTISETVYPRMFTLTAFSFSGEVGSRVMTLPNAMGRVMRGGSSGAGNRGGRDSLSLTTEQMPRHRHSVRTQLAGGTTASGRTSRAGRHAHTVWGGVHTHLVDDPGHSHNDGEYPAGAFVCLVWGGQNKIDALFNDRNHTYSVEAVHWTGTARTGVTISSLASEHAHTVDDNGDHEHTFQMDAVPAHVHAVSEDEVGQGQPIDITPAYMTTYTYIRT